MRSILESLCFGTVTGMSFSLPEDRTNKEISCSLAAEIFDAEAEKEREEET